jgi:hypothetical protein
VIEQRFNQAMRRTPSRLDLLPVAVTVSGPVPSGVEGDGRQSTVEPGKTAFDMKVGYAVRQIRQMTAGGS